MNKIILFDLDGTLIDSTEAILEGFHHTLQTYGYGGHTDDKQIAALIGHPLDSMYRELGVEEALIWECVDTYKAYYQRIFKEKTVLLECAREAIAEAAKIARLGIVTTKTGKFSKELMEHFGVMDAFEVLIGREDVTHPKPHAEPISRALELMNRTNESCWMIGDTNLDILSANHARINSVAVSSGYESYEELCKLGVEVKVDALEAVRYITSV